jgi:hypothetical protein
MANLLSDSCKSGRNTEMILAGEFTPNMRVGEVPPSERINRQDLSEDTIEAGPVTLLGSKYKNLHD